MSTPTSNKGRGNPIHRPKDTPFTVHNSILHDQKLRALRAEAEALRLQLGYVAARLPPRLVLSHFLTLLPSRDSQLTTMQYRDKDPKTIVQKHIQRLHTYNEIKDGTQALIGRVRLKFMMHTSSYRDNIDKRIYSDLTKYALMTNRTIKEVHQELELPLTD